MTIPLLDRVIQRLQALENKFEELMLSLMAGQIPIKLTKAASIEGAKVEAPTPQLKLSESKFVQIYNEIPIVLQAYTISIDWTIDSYQNPKRPPLILEPRANSNYWVIPALVENRVIYWLVPNPLRQIRFDKLERLIYLFDCPELSRINQDAEFHLVEPGRVSYYFDTGTAKWKLEQQGKLTVTNGVSSKSDPAQLITALQQQVLRQEVTLQQLQQQLARLISTKGLNKNEVPTPDLANNQQSNAKTNQNSRWNHLEPSKSLTSLQGGIKSIALTRWKGQHNKLILFTSNDHGKIEVWDLESGRFIYDITRSEEMLSDTPRIAIVPQQQILISTTENHQIKARYIVEGKEYTYGQHDEWILSLALSPNGLYLATGDRQGTVKIWNTEDRSNLHTISHNSSILNLAIDPNNRYLVAVDTSKKILFWLLETAQLEITQELEDLVWAIAISPDGKYLALGFRNGNIQIWDFQQRKIKHHLTQIHQQIWSLAFDPQSEILASGGAGTSLCLWDITTGNLISQPTNRQDIYAITFSEKGETLAIAGIDKNIEIWNIPQANLV
jgi:WD40 repeat protein